MPTGYTCDIYEGSCNDYKEYIMKCARAFGALIEMRDEPLDAPIPEKFEPDSYYPDQIKKLEEELKNFKELSLEEIETEYEKAKNEAYADWLVEMKNRNDILSRYNRILEQVEKWEPPTDDHNSLKDFAVTQLKNSINHDCGVTKFEFPIKEVWIKQYSKKSIEDEIEFYKKRHEEEIAAYVRKNKWIKDLRDSLKDA